MPLLPVNMAAKTTRDSTTNAKFKWTNGMIDDLPCSLGQFKSDMEYRNVDFNADKTKQYEAVRDAMARKY